MIVRKAGVDRHRDGARRTVVVIGSGMVLVIMAVDHLGRLARVVSGIVPMRRRGDRPEDGSGDHGGGSSQKAGAGRLWNSADASSW
jgi:hypothetical protein